MRQAGQLRTGDWAASASMGLAVAAALLAGAIGMATLMTNRPPGVDPKKSIFDDHAASALDVIVHDTGRTSTGVVNWAQTPDVLTRFGLAIPGQPNFADYQKIKSLRNGTMTANGSNNVPDYPEVKAALGLTDSDFHLRTYPVLPTVDDPRWTKDPNGRVAYVGSYTGAVLAANLSTSYVKTSVALNVTATIRNDGNVPGIFVVDLTAMRNSTGEQDNHDGEHDNEGQHQGTDQHDHQQSDGDGHEHDNEDDRGNTASSILQERNTLLLQPGQSQTVWGNFSKLDSWSNVDRIVVDATDPYGNPAVDASAHRVGPVTILQSPPGGGSSSYAFYVSAADPYVVSGNPVKFALSAYTGTGARAPGSPTARFVLVGPDGNEWQNRSVTLNSTSDYVVVCGNCTTTGAYTARVSDPAFQWPKMDAVYVSATPLFTAKSIPTAYTTAESGMIAALMANFAPTKYDNATNPQGDVFADDANGAVGVVAQLARYQTLVVGTEVSQNALNTASVRNAVRDWVQAGGNLVVLGTSTQESRWLSDVYHAAQANANGGISAPDVTHPILVTPNHIRYDTYLDRGRAWAIDSAQPFTHVLTRGAVGTVTDDTLAVANPGALGNGTVVLTSYMPAQLTASNDPAEAQRFLQNLLDQRYSMLFLDYGPSIPDGVAVGSDQRLIAIPHPNVPGAVVQVQLVMYVFG